VTKPEIKTHQAVTSIPMIVFLIHLVSLLNLADDSGNISKADKIMDVSRDAFYPYKEVIDDGGVESLFDKNRRVSNLKNRIDLNTEIAVTRYAIDESTHYEAGVCNKLICKGIFVSDIDTAYPGYLSSQYKFYVAHYKLYPTKILIAAAVMINDHHCHSMLKMTDLYCAS